MWWRGSIIELNARAFGAPRGLSGTDLELMGGQPMYMRISTMGISLYEPVFQHMVDDCSEDEIMAANAGDGALPVCNCSCPH